MSDSPGLREGCVRDGGTLRSGVEHATHLCGDLGVVRPERALAEANRILAPGGRVLVIDLLAHSEDWVREKLQHRQLGFAEAQLEELLAQAGFRNVHVQRAARDPHPPHFMTLIALGSSSAEA